jgi:hypothetical protein
MLLPPFFSQEYTIICRCSHCNNCGWFDTTADGNMTKVFNEKIDTDSTLTSSNERDDSICSSWPSATPIVVT